MPLGKQDAINARLQRRAAMGITAADVRAAKKRRAAEWKKLCAADQKKIDNAHAAWIAADGLAIKIVEVE